VPLNFASHFAFSPLKLDVRISTTGAKVRERKKSNDGGNRDLSTASRPGGHETDMDEQIY
jgi:hypothetical protein